MTVNLGTSALATAWTSLAPSLAMPRCSYCLPTMNPVMFWRKTSGILRIAQRVMKCAPFSELSEKSTPLLARMPTGIAHDPGEAADERLAVELLEFLEAAAVDDPGDDLAHVERLPQVRRDDAVEFLAGRRPGLRGSAVSSSKRHGGSSVSTMFRAISRACSSFSGVVVGDAGDAAVDVGAAQVLVR